MGIQRNHREVATLFCSIAPEQGFKGGGICLVPLERPHIEDATDAVKVTTFIPFSSLGESEKEDGPPHTR